MSSDNLYAHRRAYIPRVPPPNDERQREAHAQRDAVRRCLSLFCYVMLLQELNKALKNGTDERNIYETYDAKGAAIVRESK